MREPIKIKHTFDLCMNDSLARDTLALLKKEKCGKNVLSLSLNCYLKDTLGPLTDYELFQGCMIYISDPKASIDKIIYCITNGRLEKSKKKEMEYFISRYYDYKRNCQDLDNRIKQLKENLTRLDQEKKPGPKAVRYDDVRLENAKTNMEKKLINYINEKDQYSNKIEVYERLRIELKQNREKLQDLLNAQKLYSVSDIKKNFDVIKTALKK